ncbi:MAG: DUF2927 domain-containing protein [Paracoccaceae bacterium]
MKWPALLLALAAPAFADSQLVIDRPLSDDDFYRAVSCGAPPGGPCKLATVRWPRAIARNLSVSVVDYTQGFQDRHSDAGREALAKAITQINAAGSALKLKRVKDGARAPIRIWFSDINTGDPITLPDLDLPSEDRMEGARVYLWWQRNKLTRAVIILSHDLPTDAIGSVMLEELTQAMGFLTDLEGDAYTDVSVFSEFSNSVTRLTGQDKMALRRHYPR